METEKKQTDEKKELRTGFTTGTCAAACTRAAVLFLCTGEAPAAAETVTPSGVRAILPIVRAERVHDAVCIDIEGNFDLRHTTGSRSDAVQMEDTQALVVACELTLALQNVDLNRGLVVCGGGEHLALMGGDGSIAVDDLGAHAAQSFNAQAQRGDIQQQQTLHIALQHAALNGSAHSHALIGVDALEGLAVQFLLDGIVDSGDTGGAADHQDLFQVRGTQACILQSLADGAHGAIDQISGQLVELCAGQGHIQVLGAGSIGSTEKSAIKRNRRRVTTGKSFAAKVKSV